MTMMAAVANRCSLGSQTCKSFHIHAPATGKVRRPTVESLMAETNRLSVVENQSLCRDGMPMDWMMV